MTTPNIEELRKLADAYAGDLVDERMDKSKDLIPAMDKVLASRQALMDALQSQAERIKELEAKMVPLEKDAARYGHLMAYHVHQIAPIFGVSFGSCTPALETITKVSTAIDTARGITGEPK